MQVATVAAALEQARLGAERSGDYMVAEACRRQLSELEQLDDRARVDALVALQLVQRIGMDEAHSIELAQLQTFWDHRLAEIDEKARLVEGEMLARHKEELSELRKLAEELPQRATGNVALIELRRKESTLVKAMRYEQAAKVKSQADALESSVLDKLHLRHLTKQAHLEELLIRKQRNELSALRMRVRAGREEHLREREADEVRLMLRYRNLANDLDAQQRAEQQRLSRAPRPALAPRRGRVPGGAAPSPRGAGSERTCGVGSEGTHGAGSCGSGLVGMPSLRGRPTPPAAVPGRSTPGYGRADSRSSGVQGAVSAGGGVPPRPQSALGPIGTLPVELYGGRARVKSQGTAYAGRGAPSARPR
ncbi:hypothetical protein T492DRAFT_1098981 [Pavlovales sp. CCMP2436]|nr:hypothetical protein T492DRAFT_1098981 [Pavlovales sp. CCMP2436]